MNKHIILDSWPLGIFSDSHCRLDLVAKIIEQNPKVKQWLCLGDIVDFIDTANNRETMDNWIRNFDHIPCLRGNHEEEVAARLSNITFVHQAYLRKNLFTLFEIVLPDKTILLCYHNKPKDNWSFLNKDYTESEFIDTYIDISDDVVAIVKAHNHQSFILDFPNTFTQIWSIGAAKFGEYSIIDEKGITFKRLKARKES